MIAYIKKKRALFWATFWDKQARRRSEKAQRLVERKRIEPDGDKWSDIQQMYAYCVAHAFRWRKKADRYDEDSKY